MNIDDAKAAWSKSSSDSPKFGGLIDEIRRTERFELTILRRDVIESIAALGVAAFFASTLPRRTNWIDWSGTLVVVVGAIVIATVLNLARIRGGRAPIDASMRDYCVHELARVNRQIALLKNVKWWYIGPIAMGLSLIEIGSDNPWPVTFVGLGLLLAIFYGVHRLNQIAVRDSLMPLRSSLESTLGSIDEAVP